MSDEKKELTDELMGKVAGGYTDHDGPREQQFVFTKEEAEQLFHATQKGICPYCGKMIGT